jgi:ribonuclease P protein component
VLRLKRRQEFLRIAAEGRKWVAPGLILQALLREHAAPASGAEPGLRVGYTVSRKVGSAVQRNRARRRLRAAAEQVMPRHADDGHEFVLIGRVATLKRPFTALVGDLETALRKLGAYHD